MKGICALMFMFLVVLFAFCATAMGTVIVEIDGEVTVMSTGPPTVSVLAIGETPTYGSQDRIEAIVLMYFISDAIAAEKGLQAENATEYNPNNERSGLLLWSNYTNSNGAPIHRWIQA